MKKEEMKQYFTDRANDKYGILYTELYLDESVTGKKLLSESKDETITSISIGEKIAELENDGYKFKEGYKFVTGRTLYDSKVITLVFKRDKNETTVIDIFYDNRETLRKRFKEEVIEKWQKMKK